MPDTGMTAVRIRAVEQLQHLAADPPRHRRPLPGMPGKPKQGQALRRKCLGFAVLTRLH